MLGWTTRFVLVKSVTACTHLPRPLAPSLISSPCSRSLLALLPCIILQLAARQINSRHEVPTPAPDSPIPRSTTIYFRGGEVKHQTFLK